MQILRHQYGISVAETRRLSLLAKRPKRRKARRNSYLFSQARSVGNIKPYKAKR